MSSTSRRDGQHPAPISERLIYIIEGHRKIRGWEKQQMAAALGVTPQTYSTFITKRGGMGLWPRIKAYELGIPAEELLTVEAPREHQ
jgi:hypothetical protein